MRYPDVDAPERRALEDARGEGCAGRGGPINLIPWLSLWQCVGIAGRLNTFVKYLHHPFRLNIPSHARLILETGLVFHASVI